MSQSSTEEALWAAARSRDNHCFACGPGNPNGLHLHFERAGETRVRATFMPGPWHSGWSGVVHGGILATALDEAMAYAVFMTGFKAVTAKMDARFRAGAQRGDELLVEGWIERDRRRLAETAAVVMRGNEVIADASGTFMKLGPLNLESILG